MSDSSKKTDSSGGSEHKSSDGRIDSSDVNLSDLLKGAVKFFCDRHGIHLGITCNGCGEENFNGHRYMCTVCTNINLCSICYEDRAVFGNHETHHPVFLIRDPGRSSVTKDLLDKYSIRLIHEGAKAANVLHPKSCDVCEKQILGVRLMCDDCISYNLCYDCFKNGKISGTHAKHHSMIFHLKSHRYEIDMERIKLGSKLGEGCFGHVYQATLDGQKVAVKTIDLPEIEGIADFLKLFQYPRQRKALENEIGTYREFNCNFVVSCYGFAMSENRIALVLELMNNTLENVIHGGSYHEISLRRRFQHAFDIIRGLERIHRKGIVHKDLKMDNIFVGENATKLGDLGISFNPAQYVPTLVNLIQASYYLADENPRNPAFDMYAYGLIFVEIMSGKRNVGLQPRDVPKETEYFIPLIQSCLSKEPLERPVAEEVKREFKNFQIFWDYHLNKEKITYTSLGLKDRNKCFNMAYKKFLEEKRSFQTAKCPLM